MSRKSLAEDIIDTFSRFPWWVNILLAIISYSLLHKLAMSFYDPDPILEIGKMGQHVANKLPSSIAMFAQIALPGCFILSGLINLIKKYKETKEFKELILYILGCLIFFGAIVTKNDGAYNAINKSMAQPAKKEIVQQKQKVEVVKKEEMEIVEIKEPPKRITKNEEKIIYSWIDEKGNKVNSNVGFPQGEVFRNGKIERF